MKKDTYSYRIDKSDIIVGIQDPKQWSSFAETNDWGRSQAPGDVVGHKIWDFILGREIRHLYQEMFRRTRAGVPSRPLPFRYDSPGERRHLELQNSVYLVF